MSSPDPESLRVKVIVHADAGPEEGWGHLRESLEVAKELRTAGADCLLVLPSESPRAAEEAEAEGFDVVKIPAADWQSSDPPVRLPRLLQTVGATHLVCNLVHVSEAYAAAIADACEAWAVITELGEDERANVNFNVGQSPDFMPLDRIYRGASPRATRESVQRILISYGGSDPRNVTAQTLLVLRPAFASGELSPKIELVPVLGPLFEHGEAIQAIAASYPASVNVVGPLTPAEMALTVAGSDIALTTAGGTMYEFCALGLPCVVVPDQDKQVANAKVLADLGAIVATSQLSTLTDDELASAVRGLLAVGAREALSTRAQEAIDGRGAERIADRLRIEWGIR
jgi:spore coat polysaccharide biosynthesis predicted glycosyltransferase SpsG